jgi:hypothetical protein
MAKSSKQKQQTILIIYKAVFGFFKGGIYKLF